MVIEYTEKINSNAKRMFGIVGSKTMKMEETKTEADRYELHPKIF
jgi:hypothetical protein